MKPEKPIIDLTSYIELQKPKKTRTILICYFRLDKKAMLNALQSDSIFLDGEYFKVPEQTLLECLINRRFGETRIELEKIE